MSKYGDLLKDPRWQRKRLEIFQRDCFTCLRCGSTTRTLHVHHTHYDSGLMPWEYPNDCLRTLCDLCHGAEHGSSERLVESLGHLIAAVTRSGTFQRVEWREPTPAEIRIAAESRRKLREVCRVQGS